MEIANKVAIVTGGSSGLGQAVVEAFLQQGAYVAVFDLNIESTASEDNKLARFQLDVTNEKQVQKAVNAVKKQFGAIHICVNCAGMAPANKIIDREKKAMPLAQFAKVIDVNLMGTFCVSAHAAEHMVSNPVLNDAGERGVIINTASVAAYEGQKGQCAYAASKGAIVSMTLPMARDLSQYGVRVAAIAPGVMGTPLLLAMPEKVQASLIEDIPFPKRLGLPSEFAQLAQHIVANAYINGEVLRLDGALRMS